MYALMKANLFVHFPRHVIKYWETSEEDNREIFEIATGRGSEAMIAWSLNPFSRRAVNLVACNIIRNTFATKKCKFCSKSKNTEIRRYPSDAAEDQ